jgi:polar amino acid transport system substrate-binding protein
MERYRFSPPIAEASVALLKRKGDASVMKPADISGKAVGAGKATSQLAQLKAFGDTLPAKVEAKEYVGFNEAYADLAAGRIVAVGNSLPNIAFVAKQRPDTFEVVLPSFGAKSYFGFIGRKDADYAPLMDAVQGAMLKIKADGRMAKIQTKWFGTSFDTPDTVPTPNF